jgi:phage baseplate assembly protein W
MSETGLGLHKLGLVPLGGEPNVAAAILPENIQQARDINDDGDFILTETNAFTETNWVRQAMLIALATTSGTMATDGNFGNSVNKLGVIDKSFKTRLNQAVLKSISHLVPKYVKINSIDIEVLPLGRVEYTVYYDNLYTKEKDLIRI